MLPTPQTLVGGSFINTTPGHFNHASVVFGGPASWLRYSPAKPKKGAVRASYSLTRYHETPSVIKPGTFANGLITMNIQQSVDAAITPVVINQMIAEICAAATAYGARLLLGES